MKLKYLLVLLCLSFGCAHSVHQVHTSDFKDMKPGSRQLESEASQFVILGFVSETNYVNQAYNQLLNQCPGRITGITSRHSTSLGFLSWTNKVHMFAYCVQ